MHAVTFNYCHISFNTVWTKNENRDLGYLLRNANEYQLPRVKIEVTRRMPIYTLPDEWNRLGDARFHRNRETFEITVKNILMGSNPSSLHTLSVMD